MTRADLLNGLGVLLALALSVAGVRLKPGPSPEAVPEEGRVAEGPGRIASASTVADQLLLALCEPGRIAAFTQTSQAQGPEPHRYAGRPGIGSLDDIETIVALSPDVVLASNVASARRVARLREAGVEVIDLGAPSGWAALRGAIERVAALCGAPARGRALIAKLELRIAAIADDVKTPRRAIYAIVYGGRIYGGTKGTSYHDVLRFAGLRDVAAEHHRDFPQYGTETLLTLDPELIVTREGMGDAICGQPGLEGLSACDGGILEVDGALLDDPGLGLVDAAAVVHAAAY